MTEEQLRELLECYKSTLVARGVVPKEAPQDRPPNLNQGEELAHALWMVEGAIEFLDSGEAEKKEKAEGWLYFVQGVFWCLGVRAIEELRNDNRPREEKEGE